MKKIKLLNNLVVVALILLLVNLVLTFDLYRKLDSKADANVKSAQKEVERVNVSAEDDPTKGSKNAKVTIIEFADYQCPYCGYFFTKVLPEVEKNYIKTGKVKFVYRDFPLNFHQNAQKAAEAAECADKQGKFWQYHDKLYQDQKVLDTESLKKYAAELKLNTDSFNKCLDSGEMAGEVQKDFEDGTKYGVSGTPSFFINGIPLEGAQPYSAFEEIIKEELKK